MYREVLYADLAGALIGDVQGCTVCRFRLMRLLFGAGAKIGNAVIAEKDN